MKKELIGVTTALLIGFAGVTVEAGNNNGAQALSSEIAANREFVVAGKRAIEMSGEHFRALFVMADSIEDDLAEVSELVLQNTRDIDAVVAQVADLGGAAAKYLTRLAALAGQQADFNDGATQALAQIKLQLMELAEKSTQFAAHIRADLVALNDSVSDNSIAIDPFLADMIIINTKLTTLNTQFNLLTEQRDVLEDLLDVHSARLQEVKDVFRSFIYAKQKSALKDLLNEHNARLQELEDTVGGP